MDIGSKAFAEKMDQLSGGRFKVQVFPGGALGNALKVPETVKNGVAECGHTWMGYDWGKDPTTVLFGGYAGSFDSERMLHWLYQAGGVEMVLRLTDAKVLMGLLFGSILPCIVGATTMTAVGRYFRHRTVKRLVYASLLK